MRIPVVADPTVPPGVLLVVGADGRGVALVDGALLQFSSRDTLYDLLYPGRRLARDEAERIGRLVRDGVTSAFRWYGGPWPYGEPGEVPVSRPDREGPHRFPGVEAAHAGRDFFSSDCQYGCGAYITGFSSAPARDRRDPDPNRNTPWSAEGVGTCPNSPWLPVDRWGPHCFTVRDDRPWCAICGTDDPGAPCAAPGASKLTGILAEDPAEPEYDLGGEG